VTAGQFDLDRPDQLLKLLTTMARNKIRDKARRQQAGRRDQRRVDVAGSERFDSVAGAGFSPSRILSGRELLEAVRQQMTPEERLLADRRAAGHEWSDIAAEVGSSPDAVRKQLARALDRIVAHLGLDEVDHG
jgi:DNA-directed RNA polymerase specialized sigma24 family protein